MGEDRKIVSIILAAGKGTRMQSPGLHKVCYSLDGRPVIARAIESYQRVGIESHFVVVGQMAEQVMQAATAAPGNTFFCYQTEQKGTGNAAKAAARLLSAMDYRDDVLVVAGDKVIEDDILVKLIADFRESDCDLAFIVGGVGDFPSSGRVIFEDGKPLGIMEVFDIGRMQLLLALREATREKPVAAKDAEALALSYLKQEKKAALALGSLWDSIKAGHAVTSDIIAANFGESDFRVRLNNRQLPPEVIEDVQYANLSVYLFKAPALYAALDLLSSDNAQQEEYLTDAIGILAQRSQSLTAVPVEYPQQVMAFNTPEELEAIEEYLSAGRTVVKEQPKSERSASDWLDRFVSADNDCISYLSSVYGEGSRNVEIKRRQLISMLRAYSARFGDHPVVITRAPGRVNIMGRHVDHQGGHGNMIAIDKDTWLIAGRREDREIRIHHLEPHQFADRTFTIDAVTSGYHGQKWIDFVDGKEVRAQVEAARGDWAQYIRAPIARLQAKWDKSLVGMNILAAGNVPIAAGLSSSSALVVAAAEAVARLNLLEMTDEEFVESCGEAEWYVGTRGGAGDHAAMKFARKGQVVQVGFYPFGVVDTVDFPENHAFVVCNSQMKARKTAGAKDTFNHRVACYNIGREILKTAFPEFAGSVAHLRDFNTSNLGVEHAQLVEMLKSLPVEMDREEILESIPDGERYLATHSDTFKTYPVRSVVIYGLAECERSRETPALLRRGEISKFGQWMNISHDGDRVVQFDLRGGSLPFVMEYSDDVMDELASRSRSLTEEPGAYACSIPQIDRMVDIALSLDGVLGAQILGAGLGGCILALIHEDALEHMENVMIRQYYEPEGLEPDMFACYPIAGSGVVSF